MSHTPFTIQHNVLGDGSVALHPIKNEAAVTLDRSPLCRDTYGGGDKAQYRDEHFGGWIYSPQKNKDMVPFFVTHTGAFWNEILYNGGGSPLPPVAPEPWGELFNMDLNVAGSGRWGALRSLNDGISGRYVSGGRPHLCYAFINILNEAGIAAQGINIGYAKNGIAVGQPNEDMACFPQQRMATVYQDFSKADGSQAMSIFQFYNNEYISLGHRSDGNPGTGFWVHSCGIWVTTAQTAW